jgi:hypothetical protein
MIQNSDAKWTYHHTSQQLALPLPHLAATAGQGKLTSRGRLYTPGRQPKTLLSGPAARRPQPTSPARGAWGQRRRTLAKSVAKIDRSAHYSKDRKTKPRLLRRHSQSLSGRLFRRRGPRRARSTASGARNYCCWERGGRGKSGFKRQLLRCIL